MSDSILVKYPADIGSPPYEKWMLFEVKSGRHITRTGTAGEAAPNGDRTIKAVALYLPPNALTSTLSVDWTQDNYGSVAGAVLEAAIQAGKGDVGRVSSPLSMENVGEKLLAGGVADAQAGLINMGFSVASGLLEKVVGQGATKEIGLAASAATGKIINPRTDMFFNSVQYREHQFSFMLIPRTLQEAKEIDDILNIFQFYMLPSFGDDSQTNSYFIGYPYEFQITMFSQVTGSSHHINTIDRSVLTSCTIDHASGNRVSFVDSLGGYEYYPTSTTLTLHFKEVRLQGRDNQTSIWRGTNNQKSTAYIGPDNDPRFGKGIVDVTSLNDILPKLTGPLKILARRGILTRYDANGQPLPPEFSE